MAPRHALRVFAPVFLAGTLLVWLGSACSQDTCVVAVAHASAPTKAGEPGSARAARLRAGGEADTRATSRERAIPAAPAFSLPSDAAALLAEQITLSQLAADADLPLSSQQWERLATITLHHQAVRHAYEARISSLTQIAPGHYRVLVPAYSAAGDALRDAFYRELRATLGGVAAEAVEFKLGAQLEKHFAGFGLAVQTLDFVADTGARDGGYTVTRSIVFWNDLSASDQLSCREETHFPALEDPTGHHWGPFLSRLTPPATARKARG